MPTDVIRSILGDRRVMDEIQGLPRWPRGGVCLDHVRTSVESVRSAAESLVRSGPQLETFGARGTPNDLSQAEAIVLLMGRPPLLVQDNRIATPELNEWRARLDPYRARLENRLACVGRVELRRHFQLPWVGTGWMIDEDIVVTNRHVAEVFASGYGRDVAFRTNAFGETIAVRVDFKEEHLREAVAEYDVTSILWVEAIDGPDLAFLRLARSPNLPPPLPLSTRLPPTGAGYIGVVGYPGRDADRNDPGKMDRIFDGIYEKKRFSPGQVSYASEDGGRFSHDCATLGGSSGSAIFDFETSAVVGLHYAGRYLENNFAITSKAILSRLADFSTVVAVPNLDALADGGTEGEGTLGYDVEGRRRTGGRAVADYAGRRGFDRAFVNGLPEAALSPPTLTDVLERSAAPVEGGGYELKYTHFSVWMNANRRLAMLTAVNVDGGRLVRYPRSSDKWYADPRIGTDHQVGQELYKGNRLDRGHLVRRLDPVWGDEAEALQAMEDTFHYTNAAPQHEDLNQRVWSELEDYLLDNARAHGFRLNVYTGPVFRPRDRVYRSIGLPQDFWKIVVMARETAGGGLVPHATAYVLSQTEMLNDVEFVFGPYRTYQVPVARIQDLTGLGLDHLRPYDPLAPSDEEGVSRSVVALASWRDIVLDRPKKANGAGSSRASAGLDAAVGKDDED